MVVIKFIEQILKIDIRIEKSSIKTKITIIVEAKRVKYKWNMPKTTIIKVDTLFFKLKR